MGKVRLGPTSESGAEEVGNPVDPVVIPVASDNCRSKDASRVERASRDGTTNETEETKSETNSDGGETSLAITRGGLQD